MLSRYTSDGLLICYLLLPFVDEVLILPLLEHVVRIVYAEAPGRTKIVFSGRTIGSAFYFYGTFTITYE